MTSDPVGLGGGVCRYAHTLGGSETRPAGLPLGHRYLVGWWTPLRKVLPGEPASVKTSPRPSVEDLGQGRDQKTPEVSLTQWVFPLQASQTQQEEALPCPLARQMGQGAIRGHLWQNEYHWQGANDS